MPIYTWECDSCSASIGVRNKIEDYKSPPEKECSKCGEDKWTRQMSASVIQGNLQKGNYGS